MSAAQFSLERNGFRVVVHADSRRPDVHLWKGNSRLALDACDLISATARERFLRLAQRGADERGIDLADDDRSAIARLLEDAGASYLSLRWDEADDEDDGGDEYPAATYGGAIVDICRGASGELLWLVADRFGVRFEEEVDGRRPWPAASLPWPAIPDARAVEAALGLSPPIGELAEFVHGRVRLAAPDDVWAYVLGAWQLGTYLLDLFAYFPLLLLEGPAVRGKTRCGKAVLWPSHRGVYTPSITEATIFRNRARHRIAFMIDVEDLPLRIEHSSIGDVLLNGFERDGTVPRCTRPDAPPHRQIESFPCYGPTILVSNRAIRDDSPLASRCIRLVLPEAGGQLFPDAATPEECAEFRARALAWAASFRASGAALPDVELPLRGRVRDLARPLLRVLAATEPTALRPALALFQELDADRRSETARSWEARVAVALWECRDRVEAGRLYVEDVTAVVNKDAEEGERLTPQQVGTARRALGLKGAAGGSKGRKYVVWPGEEIVRALYLRYTPGEPSASPGSSDPVTGQGLPGLTTPLTTQGGGRQGYNPRQTTKSDDPDDPGDPPGGGRGPGLDPTALPPAEPLPQEEDQPLSLEDTANDTRCRFCGGPNSPEDPSCSKCEARVCPRCRGGKRAEEGVCASCRASEPEVGRTNPPSATEGDARPDNPCPACGCRLYWRNREGTWSCAACAPPPTPADVVELAEVWP